MNQKLTKPAQAIATQRALNAERQAKVSQTFEAWMIAVELWRQAKDEANAERCQVEADKCYWSA